LHVFGIYAATKRSKFRINGVVLKFHYLFFHTGFILMHFAQKYLESSDKNFASLVYEIGGLLALISLIVGGIH
jgi:hypothetical protein